MSQPNYLHSLQAKKKIMGMPDLSTAIFENLSNDSEIWAIFFQTG